MSAPEYEKIIERLNRGQEIIQDRWLDEDPNTQKWVRVYEKLALMALNYEIENDLLPI